MCKTTRKAHCLNKLCEEVDKLTYSSKPNYDRIRSIMRGLINFEMQKYFDKVLMKEVKKIKMEKWLRDVL